MRTNKQNGSKAKKTLPVYSGIILEALNDYRKWFAGKEDSDKETTKLIDEAIEFIQCM